MATIPEDAIERRAAAQAAAEQRPDDPVGWIALSQASAMLADETGALEAARRAFELQPDNADTIRQLAACLFHWGHGPVEARPLLERLLTLAPTDAVALSYLHKYAMFDGDYPRAIELAKRLDRLHPGDPITAAGIARAYTLGGNSVAAKEYYVNAATRCANDAYPFPYGPYAPLMPVFTELAGDAAGSEKLSLELCQDSGLGLTDLSNPRYPDNAAEAIARLQERVASRDLFIFGHGPALAETVSRRDEIASLDFASMTLNTFSLVEDNLLRPIGRRADLVCMSHPLVAQIYAAAIREWFSAAPEAILALPLLSREYATLNGGPDFLLDRSHHLFWFDTFSDLPPSPVNPLHVPGVNTLMCAFSVAVLARPRRIFLFGFDGQIKGGDCQQPGALYYDELHESYQAPRRVEPEARRVTQWFLWWESMRFNELAPVAVRHLALLFDLPLPPTYNVCVDSALNSFPCISFDRFHEIVASEGAKP